MIDVQNELIAEVGRIGDLLEQVRDAVAAPHGEIVDFRATTWAAGGVDDVDLGGVFAGVWLYNQEAFDVHVGFAPGTGTSSRKILTLGPGACLSLPFRCSFVSVGGASAPTDGGVVIAPLASSGEASGGLLA